MIRVLCVSYDKKILTQMEKVVKEILPFSDVNKEEKICFSDVKKYKPKAFVFENVPGILSASPTGEPIINIIRKAFDEEINNIKV